MCGQHMLVAARVLATYLTLGALGEGSGWNLRVRPAAAPAAASGNLGTWKPGNLEIWEFGDLGTWKSGNFGDLGSWKPRNLGSQKSKN